MADFISIEITPKGVEVACEIGGVKTFQTHSIVAKDGEPFLTKVGKGVEQLDFVSDDLKKFLRGTDFINFAEELRKLEEGSG